MRFSFVVPPVPEKVQPVKSGQQKMNQQIRKDKQSGKKGWYDVIVCHGKKYTTDSGMGQYFSIFSNKKGCQTSLSDSLFIVVKIT
jgi:hypothetical protein